MTAYWDTSSLLEAMLQGRPSPGITRSHTLTEAFSVLTGKGVDVLRAGKLERVRFRPDAAAEELCRRAASFRFVDLTPEETLAALARARKLGVRGPQIHDLMHVESARKAQAGVIYTGNEADFRPLTEGLHLAQPPG